MKATLWAAIGLCVLAGLSATMLAAESDTTARRIESLVGQLTLSEKIDMLGGTGFESKPIARLGIPSIRMTDGPIGVRWEKSTAFPVSIATAATWDIDAARRIGQAIARETKAKDRDMILGPCVNIHRVPQAGRNFESFGEDPYLAARLAVAYVQAVQAEGVIACTKHFATNNQEFERESISSKVSDRALYEIYLPAFKAAVQEGKSWSIMSAYNKLNGTWCSENPRLLDEILKKEWGFDGFVVSDWGAVHSMVPTANASLDIEMPTGVYLNQDLSKAVASGEVKESVIDDKVRRMLRVMFRAHLFEAPKPGDKAAVSNAAHRAVALDVAREAMVLLKNENGALPLVRSGLKSIAVIGPNAAVARTGGGGSSQVEPLSSVTPLDGIRSAAGKGISVRYAAGCGMEGDITPVEASALFSPDGHSQGLFGEYFTNMTLSGSPSLTRVDKQLNFDWADKGPAEGFPVDNFSARWTGLLVPPISGVYTLSVRSDDGTRLYLDSVLIVDNWSDHAAVTGSIALPLEKGKHYRIKIEFYENKGGASARLGWRLPGVGDVSEAVKLAKESDIAIVFAGHSPNIESEGFDRKTLELPADQVELINKVAAANKRTIVVLNTGAPVTMDGFLEKIPALVEAWFPGQEGGTAIAELLFGDLNFSGKLPMTFPKRWEDAPAFGHYPGGNGEVEYAEDIFVGYRHFDTKKVEPLFPFGFGLSYTSFSYENIAVSTAKTKIGEPVTVSFDVVNTGKREGSEIVQIYVSDGHAALPRPEKELKGFKRVTLKPGEKTRVHFTLDQSAFAYYDPAAKNWKVDPGSFYIKAASSSRDIRLTASIVLE